MPIDVAQLQATVGINDSTFKEGVAEIVAAIQEVKEELTKAGQQIQTLPDQVKPTLSAMGQQLEQFGQKCRQVGSTLTQSLTLPLVGLGGLAVNAATQVTRAMRAIEAGSGATGRELAVLQADFRKTIVQVPDGLEQVGRAMALLHQRTGLLGPPLQQLTKQMTDLARIQGDDLNSVVAQGTRLFGDWGIAAAKQGPVMDVLYRASQLAGVKFSELAEKLVYFGAPMRQLGFDLTHGAAVMAKFTREGVNVEQVLTTLRLALIQMARRGIKDPIDAFEQLTKKIKELPQGEGNSLAARIFGARGGIDMAAAIREGRLNLDEMVRALKASHATIDQTAQKYETFSESLSKLAHQANLALEPVGRELVAAFRQMLPDLVKVVKGIADIATAFARLPSGTKQAILGFAAVVAAAGPVINIVGRIIQVAGLLVQGWGAVAALFAGPWGAAIGLAIAALVLLYEAWQHNWGGIRDDLQLTMAWMGPFFARSWEAIKQVALAVWDTLKNEFHAWMTVLGGVVQLGMDLLTRNWHDAWDDVKTIASNVWNDIVDTVTHVGPRLVNAVKNLLKSIGQALIGGSSEQKDAFHKELTRQMAAAPAKAAQAPEVKQAAKQAGAFVADGIGQGFRAGMPRVHQEVVDAFTKTAHHAKTELEKEAEAFKKELASAQAKLATIRSDGSGDDAKIAAHYRLLKQFQRDELADTYSQIHALEEKGKVQARFNQKLDEVRTALAKLKTDALGALKIDFPGIPPSRIKALNELMAAQARLEAQKEHVKKNADEVAQAHQKVTDAVHRSRIELLEAQAAYEHNAEALAALQTFDKPLANLTAEERKMLPEIIKNSQATADWQAKTDLQTQAADALKERVSKITGSLRETQVQINALTATTGLARYAWKEWGVDVDDLSEDLYLVAEQAYLAQLRLDDLNQQAEDNKKRDEQYTSTLDGLKRKYAEVRAAIDAARGITPKWSQTIIDAEANLQHFTAEQQKQLRDAINLLKTAEQQEKQTSKFIKTAQAVADGMKSVFSSAFNDLYKNGFKSFFKSVVDGFNEMLARMAADYLASRLTKLLVTTLGSLFGVDVGGVNFGGARAEGGPMDAGRAYLVGERGPELVIPRRAGQVIPTRQLQAAGGGGMVMNVTIQTTDVESFRRSKSQWADDLFRVGQQLRARNR